MAEIIYKKNHSSAQDIKSHLLSCDLDFVSELSKKTDIESYSEKLHAKAVRYEAWNNNILVGLVAVYINSAGFDFITDVSISKNFERQGIASKLLEDCISGSANPEIRLEVAKGNTPAQDLYKRFGFEVASQDDNSYFLTFFTK